MEFRSEVQSQPQAIFFFLNSYFQTSDISAFGMKKLFLKSQKPVKEMASFDPLGYVKGL
jgi:hypothetical protein